MQRIPNGTTLTYRTSDRYGCVWKVVVQALVAVEKGADYYIVIATHHNCYPLEKHRYKYPRAAFLERQCRHLLKTWDPKTETFS